MEKNVKKLLCISLLSITAAFAWASPDYEVCFTPGGSCTQMIVSAINDASSSINVQAYSFTSKPIINALIDAEGRGVKVQIILDKSDLSGPVIPALQSANIPVWIDYKPRIAHNKVMIIDGDQVITGSFNFTASAQYNNAENLLILDSSQLANQYEQNFENRQAASVSYNQCLSSYQCSKSHYIGNGD